MDRVRSLHPPAYAHGPAHTKGSIATPSSGVWMRISRGCWMRGLRFRAPSARAARCTHRWIATAYLARVARGASARSSKATAISCSSASASHARWRARRSISTGALRARNPSPYMFFIEHEGRAVFGASPEFLVRLEGKAGAAPPAGRNAPPRRDARARRRDRRRAAGQRKGTGRARDAGGPGAQRSGPRSARRAASMSTN